MKIMTRHKEVKWDLDINIVQQVRCLRYMYSTQVQSSALHMLPQTLSGVIIEGVKIFEQYQINKYKYTQSIVKTWSHLIFKVINYKNRYKILMFLLVEVNSFVT